jgi:hypothetical protein
MATVSRGVAMLKNSWADLEKIKGEKDKPQAPAGIRRSG